VVSYDQALQVETTATPSTSGTKRRNRTKNTVPSMVFTVDAVGPAGYSEWLILAVSQSSQAPTLPQSEKMC